MSAASRLLRTSAIMLRVAAIAALVTVCSVSQGRAQEGRAEVGSVLFEGNAAFPDDSLALAIATRPTECKSALFQLFCVLGAEFATERRYLSRREFPADALRLRVWYQLRGFREATVDTATTVLPDGRTQVAFRVAEGEPIRVDSLVFIGAEDLDVETLTAGLPLRKGGLLSAPALDATRDSLVLRLANQGYAHADVLRSSVTPNDNPYRARVTFDIIPGPRARYGHISVSGDTVLSEATILRTLQFRSGDLYRRDQLLDGQSRLFGLEIIRSASVEPQLGLNYDSIIPIEVAVREGDAYRVRYGAGWTTSECVDAEARWQARNFVGGGRTLQVRGRTSNILTPQFRDVLCRDAGEGDFARLNWLGAVDFVQPWIFSTRNSFSASLFVERQSLPDIFVREAVGLQVSLTRRIGPRTPLTVSYRPELASLDAAEILFCTGFLVCAPADIRILQSSNWLAPVGLNFTRILSNNLLNPSRGYTLVVDVEHAANWTGSDFRYDRVVAEGTRYDRVTPQGVLAARFRAGWVGTGEFNGLLQGQRGVEVVHPQKRFYAGGPSSVRGFAQGGLGPRVLTVSPERLLGDGNHGPICSADQIMDLSCDGSALPASELVARPTGGTRVVEANVELRVLVASSLEMVAFADVGQVWGATEPINFGDVELTPGVGVRVYTPLGPVRVDLGYRFRGGQNLSLLTSQIRPAEGPEDDDRRLRVDGSAIPWVQTDALALLGPTLVYGASPAFSLSRLKLHFSIGQAF